MTHKLLNPSKMVFRKAGQRPPRVVVAAIARRFRDVRLMWASDVKRWVMVQVRRGRAPWIVRVLKHVDGSYMAPTLANTLGYLKEMHWSNMVGWGGKRFLEKLDQEWSGTQQEVDDRHEGARKESSERIWYALHPRTVITKE